VDVPLTTLDLYGHLNPGKIDHHADCSIALPWMLVGPESDGGEDSQSGFVIIC
jgi:hypothetical protein